MVNKIIRLRQCTVTSTKYRLMHERKHFQCTDEPFSTAVSATAVLTQSFQCKPYAFTMCLMYTRPLRPTKHASSTLPLPPHLASLGEEVTENSGLGSRSCHCTKYYYTSSHLIEPWNEFINQIAVHI